MKTQLELGATLDTLTRGELSAELQVQTQQIYAQFARGCKYLRFGPHQATPAGGAVVSDGTNARQLGPREGFVWSVRRIAFNGLTSGATPDVVELYRNSPTGIPVWQFTGNQWFYTFGRTEMLLLGGETFSFASVGTFAATATISFSGDYLEVPAEEIFKLF